MSNIKNQPVNVNDIEMCISNNNDKTNKGHNSQTYSHNLTDRDRDNNSNKPVVLYNLFIVSLLLPILVLSIWLVIVHKDNVTKPYLNCLSINKYPGYLGDIDVSGQVCIEQSGVGNIYHYTFFNLPEKSNGGWHVHSGLSCEKSGGHYNGQLSYDPWIATKWNSNSHGFVKNIADMSDIPQNVNGRNLVVHAPDGTRIGCGNIPGVPV